MEIDNLTQYLEDTISLMELGGDILSYYKRQTEKLLERVLKEDLSIAVIGQFKRGKSKLGNKILGDEILPVGIVPITSVITRVLYGSRDCEIRYINGRVERVLPEKISDFISEQQNKNNQLGVAEAVIYTQSDFLKGNIEYVDTPGVGSYHRNNTKVAYEHMRESDGVIFLLSVDSPINQIELDLLSDTRNFAGKIYFAVNKIDTVSKEELSAYIDYCSGLLAEVMGEERVFMFPVSAMSGEGVKELKDTVISDSKGRLKEIVGDSTVKKLIYIIDKTIQRLNFFWQVVSMDYKNLDKKFAELKSFIEDGEVNISEKAGMYDIYFNEYKLKLREKVMELFEVEYDFLIERITNKSIPMEKDDFIQKVKKINEETATTLSSALLYREENAYTVARKLEDMNAIERKFRRIKGELKADTKAALL